jgi:hypothetical protein
LGADVIPVSLVQSSGLSLHGDTFEVLLGLGVIAHDAEKPYFVFDVRINPSERQRVVDGLGAELDQPDSEGLIAFLESMDWEASFVYLG